MVVKRQQHLTDSTWGQRAYPLILTPNPAAPLSWWAPWPSPHSQGLLVLSQEGDPDGDKLNA